MNKILEKVARKFGFVKESQQRDFMAALHSRLTGDWFASTTNADTEVRSGLKTIRARCRDLERSNDYVRRYFKLIENNVLGANGIGLQMKIRETAKKGGEFVQQYDKRANDMIESHWWKWGDSMNCSINKRLCWIDIQRLALRSVARDGAVLIRKHYPSDNPYHFSLECFEADHLDTDYEARLSGGNMVRLGVEYNAQGAVVAYHILREHPGSSFQPTSALQRFRERVPASQMIHLYMPDRFGQGDGLPWLISAMSGLKMLDGMFESHAVACRVAAAKMGFLVPQASAIGSGFAGADAGNGRKFMDVTPGSIEQLPYGWDFKQFDPNFPGTTFEPFVKTLLRKYAGGLGVSYTSLAGDLEAVNFSSSRVGLIEERQEFMAIQGWFINWFIKPIFEEWLKTALAFGAIQDNGQILPAGKFDKFNAPEWKPRRWGYVDPLKDLQAKVLSVEKGFSSRRSEIAENGGDIEDTFTDIAADELLAEKLGLEFGDSGEQANAQQSKPDAPDDAEPATV